MLQKFTLDEKIATMFVLFNEDDRLNNSRMANLQRYKSWSDIPEQLLELLDVSIKENIDVLKNTGDEDINDIVEDLIYANNLEIFKKFDIRMFKHTIKFLPDTVDKEIKRRNLTSNLDISNKHFFDMSKFDELEKKLNIEVEKSRKNIEVTLSKEKNLNNDKIKKIEEQNKEEIDKLFEYYTHIGDTVLNSIARGNYSLLKQSTNKLKDKYQIDDDTFIEKVVQLAEIRENLRISKIDTGFLYRGIGIHTFLKLIKFSIPKSLKNMDELLNKIIVSKIGARFSDSSLLSTSKSESEAYKFALKSAVKYKNAHKENIIFKEAIPVIIVIDLKNNYILGKDISSVSKYKYEAEVLVQPGQQFEIRNLEVKSQHSGSLIRCLYVTVEPLIKVINIKDNQNMQERLP